MRRTNDEIKEMEDWEQSVRRNAENLASDGYLGQNVVQITQPLKEGMARLLIPHEVRVNPCGKYVQWRGIFTLGPGLGSQVMKEWVAPDDNLRAFILLSGERKDVNGHKEGMHPQRIIEFVKQWGPLNLYPEIHSADTPEDEASHGAWLAEPIAVYRQHARRMWGMLAVAAQVHQKKDPTPDEWAAAADDLMLPDPHELFGSNVGSLVTLIERHYMRDFAIKPTLTIQKGQPLLTLDINAEREIEQWNEERWSWIWNQMRAKTHEMEARGLQVDAVQLEKETEKQFRPKYDRPSKLLNSLVLQLLSTVTSSLYRCSLCSTPYTPTKKPRGENHFCEKCRPLAHRQRSKISYQKRKAGQPN